MRLPRAPGQRFDWIHPSVSQILMSRILVNTEGTCHRFLSPITRVSNSVHLWGPRNWLQPTPRCHLFCQSSNYSLSSNDLRNPRFLSLKEGRPRFSIPQETGIRCRKSLQATNQCKCVWQIIVKLRASKKSMVSSRLH